jgi:hypothetical protein
VIGLRPLRCLHFTHLWNQGNKFVTLCDPALANGKAPDVTVLQSGSMNENRTAIRACKQQKVPQSGNGLSTFVFSPWPQGTDSRVSYRTKLRQVSEGDALNPTTYIAQYGVRPRPATDPMTLELNLLIVG